MTREEAILLLHDMKDTYDEIHENTNGDLGYEQMTALDMAIKALQDRPNGEWLQMEIIDDDMECGVNDDATECSVCGYAFNSHYWAKTYFNYCPNCGAKMKGGTE